MNEIRNFLEQWYLHADRIGTELLSYLPSLAGALALLLLGWIAARIGRSISSSLTASIGKAFNRFVHKDTPSEVRLPTQAPKLVGDVVFWVIVLFFATAAARTAQFDMVSRWLERVVSYVPTLAAGLVIVFVGYLVSALVRDVVASAAWSAGFTHSKLMGTAAQSATFMTGLVIGLDQIGIDVSFLVTIIAIALSAALGGLALAFGLGARTQVGNLISARNLRGVYQPGQVVSVGSFEGTILEFTPTTVVLDSARGRTTVPAHLFAEQASILVTPEDSDE